MTIVRATATVAIRKTSCYSPIVLFLAVQRCGGFEGGRPPCKGQVRRAVARIRQLSCLGLGGEAGVPELIRELHGLVPAGSNIFAWAGAAARKPLTERPGPPGRVSAMVQPSYTDPPSLTMIIAA